MNLRKMLSGSYGYFEPGKGKKEIFENINKVEEIAADLHNKQAEMFIEFTSFSLAFDEQNDGSDSA